MRFRSQASQNNALYHFERQLPADDEMSAKGKQEAVRKSEAWHVERRDLYLEAASHPWRNSPPIAEPKFD